MSHWIRTTHESRISESPNEQPSAVMLDRKTVQSIIKNRSPSIAEQKNKLVLWLGSNSRPGESVPVDAIIHQSIIGAETSQGFLLVLDALADAGFVTKTITGGSSDRALLCKGWEYYEELRRGMVDSRTAFMAMQYNDPRLDTMVDEVFRPAVEQTGFSLRRLVDTPQPAGLIDDRLRVEIRTSRFLIADLTHGNQGAYWEAGYAEGLGKPVIYTCEKSVFDDSKHKPHFDTNHHLTVLWNSGEPEITATKLKATIRATLPAEAKLTDD